MSRFGERTKKLRRSKKSFSTLTIFWCLDLDSADVTCGKQEGIVSAIDFFANYCVRCA